MIDGIELDQALLGSIATEPRLMPHLHLSLQAGDDMSLKRMKRRHLRDGAIRFCEYVRTLRPDMVFGADLIAGFPTGNRSDVPAIAEPCRRLRPDLPARLSVQPAHWHPCREDAQLPGPVIKDRAARLRAAGQPALSAHLTAQIGQRHRLLTEGPRLGRTAQFAEVSFDTDQPEGRLAWVHVTGTKDGRLTGIAA